MTDLIVILLLLMIFGALIVVETSNLLFAIISFGAVGFLLSIAFLLLGAPDIAIVQIVVEIIAVVFLIRATIRRDLETESGGRDLGGVLVVATLVAALLFVSVSMMTSFPEFGESVPHRVDDAPSRTYLADGLEETGAPNIVTAVLLDYRAYDTLGEATVLFCAVLGALTVLRRKARKEIVESDEEGPE